jgi:hypothetical protein
MREWERMGEGVGWAGLKRVERYRWRITTSVNVVCKMCQGEQ